MISRIKLLIDSENISTRAFEQSIGASNGLIRRAILNNTDIQSKWISIIVDKYPHINLYWLITGKGDMYLDSNAPSVVVNESEKERINELKDMIAVQKARIKDLEEKINSKFNTFQ